MGIDFEPFFKEYEALLALADKTFEKVQNDFPDLVKCKMACADCCHALFDLPLIEALYINYHFNRAFEGRQREDFLEAVNQIDRQVYKIKRQASKDQEAGKTEDEILTALAEVRVKCPLLNDENQCSLYEFRPITCRLYGIPTSIGGKGRTCGLSGFKAGEQYPAVNIDIIQKKLFQLSERLARAIKSKYAGLGEMLVPLSMALLTEYDETYLGVANSDATPEDNTQDDE
jgi:Fe-S-cluster containining protein